MAVSLTAEALRDALRLTDSPEETAQATRLLTSATATVERRAPDAPGAIQNEAAIRVAGYLYDQPTAGMAERYGNAWRNSGAASLVFPWAVHRGGSTAEVIEDEDEVDDVATTRQYEQVAPFAVDFTWSNISASYADGDYQLQVAGDGVEYARATMAPSGSQQYFFAGSRELVEFEGGVLTVSTWIKLSGSAITPGGATEVLMGVRRVAN